VADTYTLHKDVPPGSLSDHKHERAVQWLYVIRETTNAIPADVAGLYHPVSTRQRVAKKNRESAERLISLLRKRGECLPPKATLVPIHLKPTIADALEHAEKAEAQRQPIDTEVDARTRTMRAIVQRRGQGPFRERLLDAYGRRCAITACAAVEALEAAHIVPYAGEPTNRVDNGLLLRSDIHTLFDLGLLWVDVDTMTVRVARALRADYGQYHGQALTLPARTTDRPHLEHLRSHAKTACEC